MTTAPATRRVNRGWGHSYILDGEPVDGVTTILRNGVAKPNLIKWAGEVTAKYAHDYWDELAPLLPSERLERMMGARNAVRDAAAGKGTAIHTLAQQLLAGEEVEVPDALEGHVDECLRFLQEWQVEELLVEAPVFSRRPRYAGTLDLIARLADGNVWLLDWKTGASGIWPETALQLSAYARAEFHLGPDGNEYPLPAIDRAAGVHLQGDSYAFVPVDISDDTFEIFLYAQQMARFSREPRDAYVGEPLHPPTPKGEE